MRQGFSEFIEFEVQKPQMRQVFSNEACYYLSTEHTDTETIGWKFPCVAYRATSTRGKMICRDSQQILLKMEPRPVVLPHGKVSLVSSTEAQSKIAKLEHHRQQLLAALYDCHCRTAIAELGATEATAEETMLHVDWKRSYCVPSDIHLSHVIVLARDMHHMLATTSNMAVDSAWFFRDE
jgi:hypothetical protein